MLKTTKFIHTNHILYQGWGISGQEMEQWKVVHMDFLRNKRYDKTIELI